MEEPLFVDKDENPITPGFYMLTERVRHSIETDNPEKRHIVEARKYYRVEEQGEFEPGKMQYFCTCFIGGGTGLLYDEGGGCHDFAKTLQRIPDEDLPKLRSKLIEISKERVDKFLNL